MKTLSRGLHRTKVYHNDGPNIRGMCTFADQDPGNSVLNQSRGTLFVLCCTPVPPVFCIVQDTNLDHESGSFGDRADGLM